MAKLRRVAEHIVFDDLLTYVYLEMDPDLGISDISSELERNGLEVKEVRFHREGINCDKIILGLKNHMEYSTEKITELTEKINGVRFFKIQS